MVRSRAVRHHSSIWIAALGTIAACGGAASEPALQEPKVQRQQSSRRTDVKPVELPAQDVLFALQSQLPAMRSCLSSGSVVQLQWQVDGQGQAHDYKVVWSNPQDSGDVPLSCLASLIDERHFELPENAGAGTARWTFVRELQPASSASKKKHAGRSSKRRAQGVRFDPPNSLDATEVDGVVQSGMRLYAHCLRAGVVANSAIHGSLALTWNVDKSGRASEVLDAGSDLGDQSVVDCAAECFYALQYPRPNVEPVRITYSLLFNED